MSFSIASLGIAIAAATAIPASTHDMTIQHSSGAIEAEYRGLVEVRHRQIGSPAPGGRPSTLRCAWSADLAMDRVALSPRGMMASRSFAKHDVAKGSLPGSCTTNKSAIAREVARKIDANKHILEAAREDQSVLLVELDQLVKSQNLSS